MYLDTEVSIPIDPQSEVNSNLWSEERRIKLVNPIFSRVINNTAKAVFGLLGRVLKGAMEAPQALEFSILITEKSNASPLDPLDASSASLSNYHCEAS
jgi:hypothetical protein